MRPFVLRLARLHSNFQIDNRLSRRGPRTGQALLLAVLLMVFAALIASTFITVVALNMDATATQEERQRAASAANAGAQVVNYQINANGTSWRPEQISTPPAPGDPDYSFYWTAQDIAHGYARTTLHALAGENYAPDSVTNGDWNHNNTFEPIEDDWAKLDYFKIPRPMEKLEPGFVKFPDPRLDQNTGSHTYMASVAIAGANDSIENQGMLRVTVLGQSSDDPNVFVKHVGYKGTSVKNGAFAWDQFLTNWNYKDNKNTSTTASAAIALGANTITVNNAAGFAPGRLITIQNPAVSNQIENAIVQSVNPSTGPGTIVLSSNLINAYPVDSFVRGASAIANGLIGTEGTTATPTETPQFNADGVNSTDTWEVTQAQYRALGYGLMSNTDLQLIGKSDYALNANLQTSKFYVAGAILPAPAVATSSTYHARFFDGSANGLDIPTTYGGTTPVGSGAGPQLQVKDNPTIGQPEDLTQTGRNIKPVTPPDLTKFPRYLELTKYTPGGILGLGDGVYIGNSGDVEKVFEGNRPNTIKRELSVSELQRLWQGKSFLATPGEGNANPGATTVVGGTQLHRLSFPRVGSPATDTYAYPLNPNAMRDYSLEQRGIRGWVNTYEFVPRGAMVEVQPTQIVITLDDRSDTVPNLPDSSKAWPYTQLPAINMSNCYRMVINTDPLSPNYGERKFGTFPFEVAQTTPITKFNGVIYAEGNLRVRGLSGNQDLTFVSMNNIYIEGNLMQGGSGRIALMARKNVTLNPTKFISSVLGSQDRDVVTQTIPVTATSGTGADDTTALVVSSLQPFRIGDSIFVTGDTKWHQVVRKTATGLVLTPPVATAITTASAVRIKSVAAVVTNPSSATVITVSSVAPFRYNDQIRVDDKNWVKVIGIDATANTLTLSANLAAATGDSVQILADPDFVPGQIPMALAATAAANGWPIWPTNPTNKFLPTGSTTGDYYESPEWFYRLSGPRDVLARDMRFDGAPTTLPAAPPGFPQPSPGAAAGSGYKLSTRMIGERKEAFKLKFDPDAALTPALLGKQTVKVSENTDSNTVISSGTPTNELIFQGTDTNLLSAALPGIGLYNFTYDLLTFAGSPSGSPNDNVETMSALKNQFNNDQHYVSTTPPIDVRKWQLADAYTTDVPPYPTTAVSMKMTTEEAKSIPARYFLPIGLAAGAADDWAASKTDPKRLYLSTAARQLFQLSGATLDFTATPIAKFGAADSPTGSGDVATSDTTETINNAKNFYWYSFTSSGTPTERQQWLRWSSRPLTAVSNTDNVVAVTMDSAINSVTGSTAPLRVAPFKLERSGFSAVENPYNPVTFNVQATIFAQEGSWFVIPMPLQHRNDINNSGGAPTVDEVSYATRMRRANYRVNVQGRIVQNFAPSVLTDYNDEPSPSSTTTGPVAQWADSLSYPGDVYLESATAGYRGRSWNTINYAPDTSQIPIPSNLILPPSPDLSIAG